ncbi:MAG: flagellar biosynthetic protein FliQ [Methylococcaceae bacterium]|nr:flagellar biosynthetic protein FliQ [Methylococcaceae bacterium]
MNSESVMSIARQAVETTVLIATPLLGSALIIGLVVSIFQAATQINEATLSFIPKLLGLLIVLIFLGPWILTVMTDYMFQVLTNIPFINQ